MGDLTNESLRLNDLCEDSPIKILHISGENATPRFYEWNKQNKEYSWMALPEIVGFPEHDGMTGKDIIQKIIDYKRRLVTEKKFMTKYKLIDLLFNTFLHTAPTKNIDEIMKMSDEELTMPNSFFETYIVHKPEFELLQRKSDSVVLRASPPNGALADEFKGVLKADGLDRVGWLVGYFRDFSDTHLTILFGNKHSLLRNILMYNNERGNYLQGDFPRDKGVCSPLSLGNHCGSGLSLQTFPFYNNDGVSNSFWDKRDVLFPLIKLEK